MIAGGRIIARAGPIDCQPIVKLFISSFVFGVFLNARPHCSPGDHAGAGRSRSVDPVRPPYPRRETSCGGGAKGAGAGLRRHVLGGGTAFDPAPPEHLLKACLLMAFYSIRSERQFCE